MIPTLARQQKVADDVNASSPLVWESPDIQHFSGPRHMIKHALLAVYANEGRYLLTSACIRGIAYGATGRHPDDGRVKGGWSAGFRRQTATRSDGKHTNAGLWYKCDAFGRDRDLMKTELQDDALIKRNQIIHALPARDVKRCESAQSYYRLTSAGRMRLDFAVQQTRDLDVYDAEAWLKDAVAFEYPSPHWWHEPDDHDNVYCDTDALTFAGRELAASHLGFGDFSYPTALGDVEANRYADRADELPSARRGVPGRSGRAHRLRGTVDAVRLFLLAVERNGDA